MKLMRLFFMARTRKASDVNLVDSLIKFINYYFFEILMACMISR